MKTWEKFRYHSLAELCDDISELGLDLPVETDLTVLKEPYELYGKRVKNCMATQPMEGFDGFFDGTPSDFTFRKYRKISAGGVGMIWMESFAINPNSKTCHRQLRMTKENLPVFQRLIYDIRDYAADGISPYLICQLTYIACENPYLPRENTRILTDGQIYGIIDDYVRCAALLKEAGFDCVDIRCCHGYLLSEMLSARTRENSEFGGSFENRIRMLTTIVDRVNAEVGIPMAVRITATDLVPYPYGFGMKEEEGSMEPDFTEPLKLAKILYDKGIRIFNPSLGRNHAHHLQSPSDHPALHPEEHQFYAMAYFHNLARVFRENLPEDAIVLTGTYAFAKQFAPYIAAGGIEAGHYDIAGFARTALANPNFANEILKDGAMNPSKLCITCGRCGSMIGMSQRFGNPVGCPIFDKEIYLPYYQRFSKAMPPPVVDGYKMYPLKLFNLKPVEK